MTEHAAIVIRAVEERDCPALAAMLSQSTGIPTTSDQVRARLVKSRGVEHPVVAELGEQVAGFASLRLLYYLGEDGPYAEVSELFVMPRFRQHGIGAALLSDLEQRARAAGATGWYVIADPENAAGMASYGKLGFATFAIAMQRWFSDARPFRVTPRS
jgi:GNAT superfamily N-acetyltransferase